MTCFNCGKCCGPVPFDDDFLKKNGGKFQETPDFIIPIKGKFVPMTSSLTCVFLHRITKRCLVYADRPDVCRKQGTIPQLPCPNK